MLNYALLDSKIDEYARQFQNAHPFPHLVVDDFLEPTVAEQAYANFPEMEKMDALKDIRQYKAQDPNISNFDPIFGKIIFDHLNAARFLEIVERISGIRDLKPDQKLYAAGLAQSTDGGFLNVHVDNSSHPVQSWYRRINILVYLNPHWSEEKGGHLELWSQNMSELIAILPSFNRMVMFATNKSSWHGHRRVNTPDGDTRKSINIYHFTEESPDGSQYYHVTSFRGRRKERVNQLVYPIDNFVRTAARRLRKRKDEHAVLFKEENEK